MRGDLERFEISDGGGDKGEGGECVGDDEGEG